MAVSRRVEVHRLTISGLPDPTNYGEFIAGLRAKVGDSDLRRIAFQIGTRTHVLKTAVFDKGKLKLRFFNYRDGIRPDVISMSSLQVVPNPVGDDFATVEWTHALGGYVNDRYLLLIETYPSATGPRAIEEYIERLIQMLYRSASPDNAEAEQITVNLETEARAEFLDGIDRLDRIQQATIEIVRPNPGWADNEELLAELAQDSDAKRAEVTMFARRSRSLDRDNGIVRVIKDLFRSRELDGAKLVGERDGKSKTITTKKEVKHELLNFELDASGQIEMNDAWSKMSSMMDRLD